MMCPARLCDGIGKQRYVSHKVEALNPALRKTGTQQGLGSQWCNRLPAMPPRYWEEEGMVWSVCVFRLLPDNRLSENSGMEQEQ